MITISEKRPFFFCFKKQRNNPMAEKDETWLFLVEWFDPMPQLKRKYLLKYFVKQNQAEMVDIKSKKLFLKKSPCPPELVPGDFFIGSKLLIYSRELEVVDFGDEATRNRLQYQIQQAIAILPPESYAHWGKIVDSVLGQNSFSLISLRSYQFPPSVAGSVCELFGLNLRKVNQLSGGVSLVIQVQKEDALSQLLALAESLSKQFCADIIVSRTGVELSDFHSIVTSNRLLNSSTLDNCTCCIIKPHAVKSKRVGLILDLIISQGYDVSAVTSVHMDKVQAEEFLEVYKGVVPEYVDHVVQLCSSICVALEVRAEDAVATFRQTAGPWE